MQVLNLRNNEPRKYSSLKKQVILNSKTCDPTKHKNDQIAKMTSWTYLTSFSRRLNFLFLCIWCVNRKPVQNVLTYRFVKKKNLSCSKVKIKCCLAYVAWPFFSNLKALGKRGSRDKERQSREERQLFGLSFSRLLRFVRSRSNCLNRQATQANFCQKMEGLQGSIRCIEDHAFLHR